MRGAVGIIIVIVIALVIVRRTEGTDEQGVSDPGYLSFLAS